jgi:hypothetical protein
VFVAGASRGNLVPLPAAALMRTQKADVLRVVFAPLFASFQTIITVFCVAYATSAEVGLKRSGILWVTVTVTVIANVVAVHAIPAPATLPDRIGRRTVYDVGCGSARTFDVVTRGCYGPAQRGAVTIEG